MANATKSCLIEIKHVDCWKFWVQFCLWYNNVKTSHIFFDNRMKDYSSIDTFRSKAEENLVTPLPIF